MISGRRRATQMSVMSVYDCPRRFWVRFGQLCPRSALIRMLRPARCKRRGMGDGHSGPLRTRERGQRGHSRPLKETPRALGMAPDTVACMKSSLIVKVVLIIASAVSPDPRQVTARDPPERTCPVGRRQRCWCRGWRRLLWPPTCPGLTSRPTCCCRRWTTGASLVGDGKHARWCCARPAHPLGRARRGGFVPLALRPAVPAARLSLVVCFARRAVGCWE